MIPFNFALLGIFVRRGRRKMKQTWQTICCVPHVPWRHQLLWSIHNERSVLCCLSNELFSIGSYSDVNSDEYYQNRYYLHDMVNCLNQHIAWLLSLVAVLRYHFEKLIGPWIHQNARAACIVVSLVTETSSSAWPEIDWLMCQDCSLNGC